MPAGYSLQHGPDPTAVSEGARLAVRVPHLRAAGSAYSGPCRVPVSATSRRHPGLIPPWIPPLSPWPWPDTLGVWWGHLGWLRAELRAELRAAPNPVITEAEEPPSGTVESAAVAEDPNTNAPEPEQRDTPQDVPQPEPADVTITERVKSAEPEPDVRCLEPSLPTSPCPSEAAALQDALPGTGEDESSSETAAGSKEQLQLSLPAREDEDAEHDGRTPHITVNVEVKFRVRKKEKSRKRNRSPSNKEHSK